VSNAPSITVVIPSYNCARWIGDAIGSVLGQSVQPSQIVIVDDGSSDDTEERVSLFDSPLIQYVRQANQGVSAARNNGLARASGDLIAFLDADDAWHPRKLEIQVLALRRRPEFGLVGTGVCDWPGALSDVGTVSDPPVREIDWTSLVVKNYFTTSSIVARREAIDSVGPIAFDGRLQGPEDYDLWLRIAEKWKVGNVNMPLTGYRSVAGSLGKQALTMETGMARILDKLAERGAWGRPGGLRLRRKAYSYFYYSCAYLHGAVGNVGGAFVRAIRSIATYPIPYRRTEVRMPLARLRMIGNLGVRLIVPRRSATRAAKRAANSAERRAGEANLAIEPTSSTRGEIR